MNTRAPELSALITILRVGRAGDLDPAVVQVGGRRRDPPVGVADRGGVGAEVGQLAGVEARLPLERARRAGRGGAASKRRWSSASKPSASGVSTSAARGWLLAAASTARSATSIARSRARLDGVMT